MTTLVALATKDALVMGCDSLGTVTKNLVDPFRLIESYFDPEYGFKLKTDSEGKPILESFWNIMERAEVVAYNQMTHVAKLFSLAPLEMGLMVTGIGSVGNRTIKSLINEYKKSARGTTVKEFADLLLEFVLKSYDPKYSEWTYKPRLEFMIGGYDKESPFPSIYRIYVHDKIVEPVFPEENPFGIAFGGQMQEIQRIVFGTDDLNKTKLISRVDGLLNGYREFLEGFLQSKGITQELPKHSESEKLFGLFNNWDFDGFDANWGDFSEQNAIGCVHFFVEIMINAQQFSSRLPTVGGDVHIGLITKGKEFRFISKEVYVHEGYETDMEG